MDSDLEQKYQVRALALETSSDQTPLPYLCQQAMGTKREKGREGRAVPLLEAGAPTRAMVLLQWKETHRSFDRNRRRSKP